MIKYVITDLDGTLLNSKKEIGELSFNEIKRLRKEGMHFIVASGRRIADIIRYTRKLEFDKDDYIVACDGEYIYNYLGNCLWTNLYIDNGQVHSLAKLFGQKKFIVFTENKDFILGASFIEKLIKKIWYKYKKNKRVVYTQDLKCITGNIEKIRIKFGKKEKIFVDSYINKFTVHQVFDKYIDITAINVNKMMALKELLKKLDVALHEVIYFGDDFNDLECFETFEISVSLKNGQKEILERAYFITESNDDDGVGLFLKYISKGIIYDER